MIKRLREVTRVHSIRKRNQQKAMNFNPTLQHEVRPHCPRVANGPNSSLIKTSRPLHQGNGCNNGRFYYSKCCLLGYYMRFVYDLLAHEYGQKQILAMYDVYDSIVAIVCLFYLEVR